MGKYDKEREELGLSSSTSSSSTTSKYAAERNRLLNSAQASKDDRKAYVEGMSAYRDTQLSEQKKVVTPKPSDAYDMIYGKTDKVKATLSGVAPVVVPVVAPKVIIPAIAKVKEQADRLKVANEASTKTVMAAQKEAAKAKEENYKSEPPIIRDIHKGLDSFALSKPIQAFDKVAQELYTPGAGISALNAATQGASSLVGKAAPFLAKTLGLRGGRIAQTALTEALVGAPAGVGNVLAKNPEASNKELLEGAAYGAGGGALLGGLGRGVIEGADAFTQQGLKSLVRPVIDSSFNMSSAIDNVARESLPQSVRRVMSKDAVPELFPERVRRSFGTPDALEAPVKPAASIADSLPVRGSNVAPEQPVRLSDLRDKAKPADDIEEILHSVQQPRVRDRVASFLDEQEKAALERIAKRKNNLSSNPIDEWADHAIVMASQLGKGTIKAADFSEALVKQFGEAVRPHAQAIYNKSKEVLRQQERRASKEGQEAIAFNESGDGNADTFGQKVSTKKSEGKVPFKSRWEKLRTQFSDDLAPLEGLEKRVTGSVASAEDSLYKSARMFKGVPEKAAQVVERRLAPVVDSVEKAGHSSSDLGKYALAVHAKDVNAAGIKSGFTNAEIDDVIRRFGTTEMEAARKQLVQVNKDMMKELIDNGVVSKELASVLDDRWKNYIPLFRAFDDGSVEIGSGLSKALANVASPIKTLKGSERQVIDPLENMIKNIYQSTQAAERNKVASQLHRLNEIDVDNKFIRKLKEGEDVGRKNVVNVKVNGENVKYEVEPEVYKALLNLDKESTNTLMNWLSKPASLLRAGATLTPEFSLRNPMRDIVQAFVVSKSGFNPITDFGAGLIQTISKGNLYKDWVNNLGAYGNVMSMDRNVHRQALEKVLKEPASKKFVNLVTGKSLIRVLRYITDTTESATKVGEYRAALRKGVTPQEAAYRSRDIMDFGRAGTSVRQANKVVAFLNANIQGKSKIIRAIKENPVGTITRAFAAVTVPTIGIFALNKEFANDAQNETIKNAPEWMKNSFWLMAIPGTEMVARIPKPFDLATIFANLPEKALDFVYENDKEAFDGFLGGAMKDSALPMQISGLLPIVEGMSGYSFFKEGNIVPQREQGYKKSDQYDPIRTSEAGKLLAKGVEKLNGGKGAFGNFASPRIMDNTIQGLTAGLGKYATDAVDSILQGMVPFTSKKVAPAIVNRPPAPSKSLEQKPFIRSFLVDPNQGGKIMDKFYSDKEKLTEEKASNKLNEITFGGTKKKPLYLEKEKSTRLKTLSDASDDVSDINKEIRTAERSMTLTPKQKREQIDLLITKRNKVIKDSISKVK